MVSHFQYTKALSKIGPKTILVIGDVILDQYTYGTSKRISPEAPVPVVLVDRRETKAGGAGNVALNLSHLGMKPRMVGRIGGDPEGALLRSVLEKANVDCRFLFVDDGALTTVKNRIIVSSQQLIRIDDERHENLSQEVEETFIESISDMLEGVDLIAISDYAKGTLTDRVLQALIKDAVSRGIPCITDPKGTDFRKYSGSTIIKPNYSEAMAVFGAQARSLEDAAQIIFEHVEVNALIVTRSEKGISLFYRDGVHEQYPVAPKEVRDVTGAGDTVLAVLAACLASEIPLHEALPLANVAASCAIEKIGCAAVTLGDIAIRLIEQSPTGKICNEDSFRAICLSMKPKDVMMLRFGQGRGISHEQIMKLHCILSKKPSDKLAIAYVEEGACDEEFLEFLASLERIWLVVHAHASDHSSSSIAECIHASNYEEVWV